MERPEPLDRRGFLTRAGLVGAAAASGALAWTGAAQAGDGITGPLKVDIGQSTRGRPIRAYLIGDRQARNRYVVLGQMHGDEPAGSYVVLNRLLDAAPLEDVALWLIPTLNPDGRARGTRTNARGVDLNRNFPSRTWVYNGTGTRYYSGPRPASEPETRALVRFLTRVEPRTVVSLHQPLASVDFSGGDEDVTRWLARSLGLPVANIQVSGGGTMTSWFNREFRRKTAVTVELPRSTSPEYRKKVAEVLLLHAQYRRV
jgi:murein peptide amidase A